VTTIRDVMGHGPDILLVNRRNLVQNGLPAHAVAMDERRVHAEVLMERLVHHQALIKRKDR
jgi:hypothetical protein